MSKADFKLGDDGLMRCSWPTDDLYIDYHDNEWGVPEYDDKKLFEKLILDGFQAGLSWITILKRRDGFYRAFENFDVEKIANYGDKDFERLMIDEGIIRNRLKIKSTIKNAKLYLDIMENEGFSNFLWKYVEHKPIQNNFKNFADMPAESEISRQISKDMKKLGFGFCGPTIIYAFMQAVGMVNDHLIDCYCHEKCLKLAQSK